MRKTRNTERVREYGGVETRNTGIPGISRDDGGETVGWRAERTAPCAVIRPQVSRAHPRACPADRADFHLALGNRTASHASCSFVRRGETTYATFQSVGGRRAKNARPSCAGAATTTRDTPSRAATSYLSLVGSRCSLTTSPSTTSWRARPCSPKGSSRSHVSRRSNVTSCSPNWSGSHAYEASMSPAGPPCTPGGTTHGSESTRADMRAGPSRGGAALPRGENSDENKVGVAARRHEADDVCGLRVEAGRVPCRVAHVDPLRVVERRARRAEEHQRVRVPAGQVRADAVVRAVWVAEERHALEDWVARDEARRVEIVLGQPRDARVRVIARADEVRGAVERVAPERHIERRDAVRLERVHKAEGGVRRGRHGDARVPERVAAASGRSFPRAQRTACQSPGGANTYTPL
eukprot:4620598-Prymnesium_polylepis.1